MNASDISSQPLDRRRFLGRTAAATGGLMVATSLSAQAAAYVGGNDHIKVALIGCGGRGTKAASQALTASSQARLVAMADVFPDRLEESYRNLMGLEEVNKQVQVKDKHKFLGFDAYQHAIKEADVVLLATPPGFRPLHLEYAIEQGKHVFMEKPVAVDAPGIRRVLAAIKLAKTKDLSVVAGLQRRFARIYREEMMPRLREGLIGDIVAAYCYWNIGFIRPPKRQPGQSELEYQMRNWYQFPWLSGDHILDTHIHNLDVVNWAVGFPHPVKARGMGGRSAPYEGDAQGVLFDHHAVEFEYENGLLLSSQCRQTNGCWFRLGEYLVGTKGRIDASLRKVTATDHQGKQLFRYRDREDPDPQQLEHDILFNAIVNGKPDNSAEYSAYSTMTAIMGRMASYSGKELSWEDALKAEESLAPEISSWASEPPRHPDAAGSYGIPVPGREA